MGIREAQTLEGRYRLVERLGIGGMSVVWRGYDEVLGRQVAIKMLAPALAPDHASRDRIRAEAQAVARLCHPHITSVFDYGEARGTDGGTVPYVVMELIDGEPMSAQLRYGAALPWHQAVTVCAQVASALAVAHACGIVHRDVTPNNVMLTEAGAKVVDFGISAAVGENDIGADGTLLGTPAYLAPERMDAGVVCPASDVYAVGLLLYRSLTGRLPWRAANTTDLLKAHRYVEPGPMQPVTGLPDVVVTLCRRCLAKRPEDRPSTAGIARVLAAEAGIVVYLPGPARVRAGGLAGADGARVFSDGVAARGAAGGAGTGPISLGTTIRPWPPPAAPHRPQPGTQPRDPGRSGTQRRDPGRSGTQPCDPGRAAPPASAPVPARGAPIRRFTRARRRGETVLAAAVLLVVVSGLIWIGSARTPDRPAAGGLPGAQPLALVLGRQPVECKVGYRLRRDDGRDFAATVTVTNTGAQPVDDWRLEFAFPGDQWVRRASGAVWRQSGRDMVVRPGIGEQRLRPGHPVRLGVSGRYRGANPLPVVFTLNGSACQAVVSGLAGGTAAGRSANGDGRQDSGDSSRRGGGRDGSGSTGDRAATGDSPAAPGAGDGTARRAPAREAAPTQPATSKPRKPGNGKDKVDVNYPPTGAR